MSFLPIHLIPRSFFGLAALSGLALVLLSGCVSRHEDTLFRLVPAEESGLFFSNTPTPDTSFNIINYPYFYDGGGVAAGDVNNDGLVDLFFTANDRSNRLYVNRGHLHFEDVTESAGVSGNSDWKTGVTMADVNGDGHLDIYVMGTDYRSKRGQNELYLNNGDLTFTESAERLGLAFRGYGRHATWFDYDRDGDLDVFLVNHSTHDEDTYVDVELRLQRHDRAGDRLYRNDNGSFTEVTAEAGIYSSALGYGLSATAGDVNVDGCPDLYVANDFHENDYLYLNRCDGTFVERLEQATGHTSLSSMGTDMADVNNDGLPDIVSLDMLPFEQVVLNSAGREDDYQVFDIKREAGYQAQYTRNMLQLNRGNGRFSEIGRLAGIEATDWSWSPLLADLDNDGLNDLFITNGIYRRPNDLDYVRFIAQPALQHMLARGIPPDSLQPWTERMPRVPLSNAAYHNTGGLTFRNEASAWGLAVEGFSHGSVYADLDNDGDLDLVTNNVGSTAFLFENKTSDRKKNHWLTIKLQGDGLNTSGIGARVQVDACDLHLARELFPSRGFQSSVDPRLFFGLGACSKIDSTRIVWPDGRFQRLTNPPVDRELIVDQREAAGRFPETVPENTGHFFEEVTDVISIPFRHRENVFNDFNREPLLPHKLSTEGPALAVGDVNGDGLDDFFVGGARDQASQLYLQQASGSFIPTGSPTWAADSLSEDVDALFFDADRDRDLDLYVVTGGNEFWGEEPALLDRLYLNDGRGTFTAAPDRLPPLYANGSVVRAADYDRDGDLDLFVGSRSIAWQYGITPPSYLLENDGSGRFRDATTRLAPSLLQAGLITDAVWTDLDGDGLVELVVAGEWMPIRVFSRQQGTFVERTETAGLSRASGWWRRLEAVDVDGDRDIDLVAGNLGMNTLLRSTAAQPTQLYVKDWDGNGHPDPILTTYHRDTAYPFVSPDLLMKQIPGLRMRFTGYHTFGAARLKDLFTEDQLQGASVLRIDETASTLFLNRGRGTFEPRPLPVTAQLAPLSAMVVSDVNRDGLPDLIAGGQFSGTSPLEGRYDGLYGVFLLNRGRGRFEPVEPRDSGLWFTGDVRTVKLLRTDSGGYLLLVARNDDRLQVFRPLGSQKNASSR